MPQYRNRQARPSTHEPEESPSTEGTRDVDQKLASGRPASTPFALTGIVALVIWSTAAMVAAVLFLVIWLA
jgi:hypothetical protein